MSDPERKKLINFLNNPDSYVHNPGRVEHIQTHASDIFIVPPYVYKVKKPVDLGFLDFSTLAKRKYFCEREVELNRRLCDDVYLGIEKIVTDRGSFYFGNSGEVFEYAVKMRRLDDKYFLKNILKFGKVAKSDFLRVVEKLESFYKDQETSEEVSENGKPENLRLSIDENVKSSSDYIGKTILSSTYFAIDRYNQKFFKHGKDLFLSRIKEGFIKDCHGDLHLEHINICPDRVCIYDCIEFNDIFRHIDIASDIAFLSMDLDYKGFPQFSDFIVSELSRRMGDSTMYEVLDFYKCYRAFVRGKVESIKCGEEEVPENERKDSADKARNYFRLALKYALFGSRPCVIIVFGMIGTGKSTVSEILSEELGAEVFSSDRTRKEITGKAPGERDNKGFGKGIYTPEITEKTYTEILRRGFDNLGLRGISILDATYSGMERRKRVREEARKSDTNYIFIETTVPDDVIIKRLQKRKLDETSVSDAGADMFEMFKKSYDEPSELEGDNYIKIDTRGDRQDILLDIFNGILDLQC